MKISRDGWLSVPPFKWGQVRIHFYLIPVITLTVFLIILSNFPHMYSHFYELEKIIHKCISSCIDYSKSPCNEVNQFLLSCLQLVQNAAARLFTEENYITVTECFSPAWPSQVIIWGQLRFAIILNHDKRITNKRHSTTQISMFQTFICSGLLGLGWAIV